MSKICIIGCGNIGYSVAKGLIGSSDFNNNDLVVTNKEINHVLPLKEYGVVVTTDNVEGIQNAEIIIMALKPCNFNEVISEISPYLENNKQIIVSLATEITISQIEKLVAIKIPIFRAMPNIASEVNQSITCISHAGQSKDSLKKVCNLFNSVGTTSVIEEDLMEAATILGACGIAFVMKFIRAMTQGGIQIGLDAETAKNLVNHTVKGASQLLLTGNRHPETEIDKAATPKGCTIVGLNEMNHKGFTSSLIKGIIASYKQIEKNNDNSKIN